jgi:hypothetical protein
MVGVEKKGMDMGKIGTIGGNLFSKQVVLPSPKRRHDLEKTNREVKDKMPKLQQNHKYCNQTHKAKTMQHFCFCPNHPKI